MNPIIRNVLAVLAGAIIGGLVNGGLIQLGMNVIPWPEVMDFAKPETIEANADLLETHHFLFPFIAHALGTLVGAIVAAWAAANNNFKLGMIIGPFFLIGGILAARMIPAPLWFNILDLGVAYIPMAWLGAKIGEKRANKR